MRQDRNTLAIMIILLASVFTMACCSTSPFIQVTAIKKPSMRIIERHDQYVKADATLSTEQFAAFLVQSASLRQLLETNEVVRRMDIEPLALPVCARHDQYVVEDQELDALHTRTYLRTTEILLEVIAAGN